MSGNNIIIQYKNTSIGISEVWGHFHALKHEANHRVYKCASQYFVTKHSHKLYKQHEPLTAAKYPVSN